MQISEYSFTHLYQMEEERLTVELERRRVLAERADEAGALAAQGAPGPDRGPDRGPAPRRHRGLRRLLSHPGGTM